MFRRVHLAAVVGAAVLLAGCNTVYYEAMESLGYEKRDLLVGEVEDARDAQEKAKEQFADALEEFTALTGFEGGDLERVYRRLNKEYERSLGRAEDVRARITDVERVAEDLFAEWSAELNAYQDRRLRARSEQQLRQTRGEYDRLIAAMRAAAARMTPVLETLQDQVLYLKHNLNARAIASLEGEVDSLEGQVRTLIDEMEAAIEEANRFINAVAAG